jgi:hypothetical protein
VRHEKARIPRVELPRAVLTMLLVKVNLTAEGMNSGRSA